MAYKALKKFGRDFLVAVGTLSGFVTIIWAFFPNLNTVAQKCPWGLAATTALLAIGYAITANYPKNSIKVKISEKVSATVKFYDLFSCEGILVIPVNEYFDTKVDEKIISSNTLHGKFIKRFFGGNEEELREKIQASLSRIEPAEKNALRTDGNKTRYPLGTVCEIEYNGNILYLVALSRFNENNRAEVTNAEYLQVLIKLFSYIEQYSQGRTVNIPLIGGGHGGVNLPAQKLLEFLLLSMLLQERLTLINGVNIVLHESVKEKIDLVSINELVKVIGA